MRFAHMKRILRLDRLRLRGLSGVKNEVLLTGLLAVARLTRQHRERDYDLPLSSAGPWGREATPRFSTTVEQVRQLGDVGGYAPRLVAFAVTHGTAFTVKCDHLLRLTCSNARRDTMMRRTFTMVVVGSLNSPFRGMTNLRATQLIHLRHRFFQWRRHVHLCHELMSLSDEELRDIGLSRTEAEIKISKVFWLP